MITVFHEPTLLPSRLESPQYLINTPQACVKIEYLGDISRLTIRAVNQDSLDQVTLEDRYFVTSTSWRTASVRLLFYMFETRGRTGDLQGGVYHHSANNLEN